MRAQTADVGREFERQHGNSTVGEIDAGAAKTGFLIQRRIWRNVLGDVGDVDLEFVVSVFELANVDGVVEIAGGFSVDGDDGEMAVVAAAAQGLGADGRFDRLRFFDDGGREAVGQVKLADHDFDVDSEIAFLAEDFDDASAGLLRSAGPVGDFYVDDEAVEIVVEILVEILTPGVDPGLVANYAVNGLGFLSRGFV